MALLRNGLSLSANPLRSGGSSNVYGINRGPWTNTGSMRGFCAGEATVIGGASIADTAARPNGYEGPYAWLLACKGGGMSAYLSVVADAALASNLAMGINIESAMAADGSITTATMQAIANLVSTLTTDVDLSATAQAYANLAAAMAAAGDVAAELDAYASLLATMTADGSVTSAPLSLVVSMASTMAADGSISSAPLSLLVQIACTMLAACDVSPELVGVANMASALAASGDVTAAMGAIAFLVSEMTSAPAMSTSTLRATLSMEADMSTAAAVEFPTAAQNAAAVWEYLLAGIAAGTALTRTTPTTAATVVDDAGNTATTFLTDLAETADNHWKDAIVSFASGALLGQVRRVTVYSGTTKAITVLSGFTSAPSDGDAFVLINR